MSHTHSLAEWASVLSGSVGVYASCSAVFFLLVDAHRGDFDPRPWLARVVNSEAVYPLLREFDNARHASREALREDAVYARLTLREAALTAAALLALLIPTSPERAA